MGKAGPVGGPPRSRRRTTTPPYVAASRVKAPVPPTGRGRRRAAVYEQRAVLAVPPSTQHRGLPLGVLDEVGPAARRQLPRPVAQPRPPTGPGPTARPPSAPAWSWCHSVPAARGQPRTPQRSDARLLLLRTGFEVPAAAAAQPRRGCGCSLRRSIALSDRRAVQPRRRGRHRIRRTTRTGRGTRPAPRHRARSENSRTRAHMTGQTVRQIHQP